MHLPALTSTEHSLLLETRVSDEDHGGLASGELSAFECEVMERLCALGLVEAMGEYGEAPDGEEDERQAWSGALTYRVTGLGVLVLLESA